MPGFLSHYDGREHIELGNGYWIDIKQNLPADEWQRAQSKLGAGRQRIQAVAGQEQHFADIDMGAFQMELVVLSITDWNLDDERGKIWPVQPEQERRKRCAKLPDEVFMKVFNKANERNKDRDTAEAATFPEGPVGGDPEQDDGTAGAAELPDPEGVLGAPGGDPGEPEDTPAP